MNYQVIMTKTKILASHAYYFNKYSTIAKFKMMNPL